MLDLPSVMAHRGASAHAPENTLAAIREAARQGARWTEVDVVLSKDGVPVLFHDDLLDRTSTGTGPVGEATLEHLRTLDAGSWFGPQFAGERVPTLQEFLELCLDLDMSVNLEIKPQKGLEARTAEAALDLARRIWPGNRPAPMVSSFKRESLQVAKAVVPHWPRGILFEERPGDWAEWANAVEAATFNINHNLENPASIAMYRATGRSVVAWTVNDPERARQLWSQGVSTVITDTPKTIKAVVPA